MAGKSEDWGAVSPSLMLTMFTNISSTMLNIQTWSTDWGGTPLTIETGRYALQANAALTVRYGDTVMMATVVKSDSIRAGIDYFPLMVDFEEKLYAAGRIKGSRFIKREGRPSDDAILSGRLIDRAIRPLFDDRIRNDVQVIVTALSIDGEHDSAFVGLIAASAVLSISSLRWNGPIGAARIGRNKETGEFILNVSDAQIASGVSDLDLMVAGTPEKLIMTEAGAVEVPDDVVVDAMKWGCAQLTPVVDLIARVQRELGVTKESFTPDVSEELARAEEITTSYLTASTDSVIFAEKKITKQERTVVINALKTGVKDALATAGISPETTAVVASSIKERVAGIVSARILSHKQRLDGRGLTEIRSLLSEIDLLPRTHGSALFMRGDTQVLSLTTLGAPGDVQTLDSMEEVGTKRYMHHYNDAPFTYGEAGPLRGPGRRAIGHGALAERALEPVLPSEESFPYAIRVVSEVMGSNGSSSMASTCASSLSLMAAGVPIKKPVAGIAMGLASRTDESGSIIDWEVLTDLQDIEDGRGGMDFKIAGTADGITAVQMDTKTAGLSWDIVEKTFAQSKAARQEILLAMQQTIAQPKADLSPYAPRIETLRIDPEKIGDVIGPGGKIIKKIIEETQVQIDIEQDGRVLITAVDMEAMARAKEKILAIVKVIEAGEEYEGPVVRLEDFGAFVQLTPNKDGLVHVSEISWERTNKPSDVLKIGQVVKVLVKEIDQLGRVNLTMRGLTAKPEGYVEPPPRPPRTGGPPRGGRSGGGGFRRSS